MFLGSCAAQDCVRLRNDYKKSLEDVTIGDVEFGTIPAHTLTEYRALPAGEHLIKSKGKVLGHFTMTSGGPSYLIVFNDQAEIKVSRNELDLVFY